ncbi:MAG: TolC family outer membrane protein [Beijerinckiaceae bacterium]
MRFRIQKGWWLAGVAACALGWPVAALAETLAGALARAYNANPTLNVQRAAVRVQNEGVPQALSGYRPRINATADAGIQSDRTSGAGASQNGSRDYLPRGVSLTVDQTIWNGNRTGNSVRSAESVVFREREVLRNTELQVLLDSVIAYMDVMRDTATLNVRRQNIEVIEEQLRQVNDRFRVGEVTRTDVAQAESRLAAARATAAGAEATLRASIATYRQRIGQEPKSLGAAKPVDGMLPKNLKAAIDSALGQHPAIQAAMHGVDAAQLNVKVVEGELYPTLSARGTLSQRWDLQDRGIQRQSASLVAQLSIPIYEGGQVYSRVRQAKETLGQQRLNVDVVREQVRQAVTAAWANVEATRLRVTAAEAQVQAATVALSGVREEAKVGQRTTLDVLNSQQELADGRVTLVAAQRDRVVATYSLLSALGRLTAERLNLKVARHDPTTHFNQVRDKWIGTNTPDGR